MTYAFLRRITTALLLPLTLAACESVVGGGRADFEVFVLPDGSESAGPEGSLTVRLRVSLESSDLFPVEISGGEREVTLDLLQSTPESLGTVTILQGIYQGVRVHFTNVEADVGNGEETASVRVDFGEEESLRKDYGGQVLARDEDEVAVTVDLRASEWLEAADEGLVPAEAFLDAVRILVAPR